MTKQQKSIILALIAVALAVISFLILPDEVVMQVRIDGEPGNIVPKTTAVIAPLLISGMGLFLYVRGDGSRDTKNFILVIAGYIVSIFEIVVNVLL